MRTWIIVAVLVIGCKTKKSDAPAGSGSDKTGTYLGMCCCTTTDNKDGTLIKDGQNECADKKGRCTIPITKQCESQMGQPAAGDAPCCCVSDDVKGGTIAIDGAKECSTKKGKCVTPMTKDCESEVAMDKAAEERNQADDDCPSHDRKDCDGDGFRYSDDKNDMDPKVH
jgi:hypothetical protein